LVGRHLVLGQPEDPQLRVSRSECKHPTTSVVPPCYVEPAGEGAADPATAPTSERQGLGRLRVGDGWGGGIRTCECRIQSPGKSGLFPRFQSLMLQRCRI
jgi:hypothetical protein